MPATSTWSHGSWVPARPAAVAATKATRANRGRWLAGGFGRLVQVDSRRRASARVRVTTSSRHAATSASPIASGRPASGPKGSPVVRDHAHSRRGPAETAAAARSAPGRNGQEQQTRHGQLGNGQEDEERSRRGPLGPVLGHDGGVDDRAADQPGNQQDAQLSGAAPASRADRAGGADGEPSAEEGDGPGHQHEVGDEEDQAPPADGPHLEPEGRVVERLEAASGAGLPHRAHHEVLMQLEAVVVRRAGRQLGDPRQGPGRDDEQPGQQDLPRPVPGRAEPVHRQGERAEHGEDEERHGEGGLAHPGLGRGLGALDGSDGTAQGGDPEPVREGQDHGHRQHRPPGHAHVRGRGGFLPHATRAVGAGGLDARHRHQVISQPNIMAWSSCARLWQCDT